MNSATTTTSSKPLISVQPEDLKFVFELEKQTFCDLKVTNNTDQNVAFKVKTTSPKKYFVRPNTGVIHPWDSCVIRVTLQAQREYPPDMQCKDKFLLQSTIVSPDSEDDLPQDTFNKDSGRTIEECKLKVVYASPHSSQYSTDDDSSAGPNVSVVRLLPLVYPHSHCFSYLLILNLKGFQCSMGRCIFHVLLRAPVSKMQQRL
ncbi:hypothetical protein RND81_08G134900 [Saponaria officinalis]|uniref:MSP domain-containing protein n=1 Tax=Saponaria officinalis TaxID=3572 RepID=A0AAW1J8D3_SAPOF